MTALCQWTGEPDATHWHEHSSQFCAIKLSNQFPLHLDLIRRSLEIIILCWKITESIQKFPSPLAVCHHPSRLYSPLAACLSLFLSIFSCPQHQSSLTPPLCRLLVRHPSLSPSPCFHALSLSRYSSASRALTWSFNQNLPSLTRATPRSRRAAPGPCPWCRGDGRGR